MSNETVEKPAQQSPIGTAAAVGAAVKKPSPTDGEGQVKGQGGGPAPATSTTAKTPVSLLQELYIRKGITPTYDLVQVEGQVHEPTFKYRVVVGEFFATGVGQSKKKAKHSAALAVLEKIRNAQQKIVAATTNEQRRLQHQQQQVDANGQVVPMTPGAGGSALTALMIGELPDLSKSDGQLILSSPHDDGIDGNPVGELQELCMNRRMQPPGYTVSHEEGQPHVRKFVIICSVANFTEAGAGKSKKLAKRQAAHKMLLRLKVTPVEQEETSLQNLDEDELALGIAARERNAEYRGKQTLKFYQSLRAAPGTNLAAVQTMKTDEMRRRGVVELLDEVGNEQHFNVTYIGIEERSARGDFHCLVQLSSLPVAVCFGVGKTEKAAKDEAAFNALTYLKIMTKK